MVLHLILTVAYPPHFIIFIKSHHNLIVVSPFSSENKPKNGGICVANHTSPIDVIILASDGCYAMVTILAQNVEKNKTFTLVTSSTAGICWSGNSPRNRSVAIFVFVLLGWTNPWRLDGGHSEIHGQSLSTHLVWTLRSKRQTSCGQKVELQSVFKDIFFLYVFMTFYLFRNYSMGCFWIIQSKTLNWNKSTQIFGLIVFKKWSL